MAKVVNYTGPLNPDKLVLRPAHLRVPNPLDENDVLEYVEVKNVDLCAKHPVGITVGNVPSLNSNYWRQLETTETGDESRMEIDVKGYMAVMHPRGADPVFAKKQTATFTGKTFAA